MSIGIKIACKADLDDRLYKMYDKIEDIESLLITARAKKTAIETEKLTSDNIYKVLICFDNETHIECCVKLIKE